METENNGVERQCMPLVLTGSQQHPIFQGEKAISLLAPQEPPVVTLTTLPFFPLQAILEEGRFELRILSAGANTPTTLQIPCTQSA